MDFRYNVSFMDCQKCGERVHCDTCEEKLITKLNHTGLFASLDLNIANKLVSGKTADADEDDILDALEEVGLFC